MSDLVLTKQASGFTPGTGKKTLYVKSDGNLYLKDEFGAEVAWQTLLTSGVTIKTINGTSVLGSGDLVITLSPTDGPLFLAINFGAL